MPSENPGSEPPLGVVAPTADAPAPTGATARITNLDTVRGVATLGILVMNAVSFALPEAAYFNLEAAGRQTLLDWVIGVAGEIFVDQKTMALFSMLFGAGIALFADRAAQKHPRPVALSLWRNALLLGIGILHGLLWEGDVLRIYAVCAPFLILVRNRSPRALATAGAALVVGTAAIAAIAQTQIPTDGDGLGTYWFVDGGPIGDTAGIFLLSDFFFRAAGMMLIGVAAYRVGIIQGTRPPSYYRRMALGGLAIGLPLAAIGVAVQLATGFSPRIALIGEAPNTLATIPLAFGYLGLITLWNQRATTWLHERVRAVGRMALTNYLIHSLAGILLFRVILDRGDATRTGVAVFVLFTWVVQAAVSKPWLNRHRFGPAEWAWRRLTYMQLPPFRGHQDWRARRQAHR